jgi:hypothetical protein
MDGLHAKATNYEGKIISLKLINAEQQMLEAVGEYVGETPELLRMRNLQAIVPQQVAGPDGKPQMSVGFMHFMLSGDPTEIVEIYKHTIIGRSLAKKEVVSEMEKLNSPVTVPKTKIIT